MKGIVMLRLTKDQLKQKADWSQKLGELEDQIQTAVDAFNAVQEVEQQKIQVLLDQYEDLLSDARSFCEEIASEQTDYWDDRSETWQASDKGRAYEEWLSQWENSSLSMPTPDWPSQLEIDLCGQSNLDELADEIEAV